MSKKPSRYAAPHRGKNSGKRAAGSPRRGGRPDGGKSTPPSRAEPRERGEWLYGRHAVTAALRNPARQALRLLLTREAEDMLGTDGVDFRLAPEIRSAGEITAQLPEGAAHQGFALLAAPLPEVALDDVIAALGTAPDALVVVLDQVTDPRNVGAILRSAAAFGAAAVILPARHGAETTGALAKTASGALESVSLVRVTNVARALEALKTAGFWCVALETGAAEALADVALTGRTALVLGSEGAGLRRLVSQTCDIHARLPIGEGMESLNVSAAAAVALYEAARRKA